MLLSPFMKPGTMKHDPPLKLQAETLQILSRADKTHRTLREAKVKLLTRDPSKTQENRTLMKPAPCER